MVGILGDALKWFKSYLSERQQTVYIENEKSKSQKLIFGIPQGSILGPILFSLYTLPLADIVSNCIKDVKRWMTQNMLQLNTDKTKCMVFGSPPQLRKLKYSTFNAGGEIELVSSARNLGIILDSTFAMTDHITKECRRSSHQLRNLSHIRRYLYC